MLLINANDLHLSAVCHKLHDMRLLIAFLVLAGISVGALGYLASNSKTQGIKGANHNRVDDSAALSQINKANPVCKNKCCD